MSQPAEEQLPLFGEPSTEPLEGELIPTSTSEPPTEGTQEGSSVTLQLNMGPLEDIANGKAVSAVRPANFSRKDVVDNITMAFELIGGVPRLALWGSDNPNEFYKIYGKLMPSQNSSALGETNTLKIEMAIKPGALDT